MESTRSFGWLVILFVVISLAGVAMGAGAVPTADTGSTAGPADNGPEMAHSADQWVVSKDRAPTENAWTAVAMQDAEDEDAPDNETTRHQNPYEVGDDGDDAVLADWLSNQLGSSLGESTVQLSEGQYEQAQSVIGDEYDQRLEQYVEVSEDVDTGGNGDDESDDESDPAQDFQEAQDNQRGFVDSVEEYRETYDEYQEAREEGDEERARSLARELEQYAERTDQRSDSLTDNYANVSVTTDQEFEEETETVEELNDEIAEQQAEVREAEFEETDILVDIDSPDASFSNPLAIDGTVTTEDGEPVEGGQVAILMDGRATTTAVTGGLFELEYRPALAPTNASDVTVTYVPDDESVYLQSETTVPIDPATDQPTIEVTNATDTAAYGESVTVEGRVVVEQATGDDIPVDGIPVAVSFGEERELNTVRTADDGTFAVETIVPADVPAGETTVSVEYPPTDRSLEHQTTDHPIRIEETDTELSVDATVNDSGPIDVSGLLQTGYGDPLDNESVQLSMGQSVDETVETSEDGTFEATLDRPTDADSVELVATYEDPGTNLADDTAVIELPIEEESSVLAYSSLLVMLLGVVLIVAGFSLVLVRPGIMTLVPSPGLVPFGSGNVSENSSAKDDGKEDNEDRVESEQTESGQDDMMIPSPRSAAQPLLEDGDPDAATSVAYALTRRGLEDDVDDGRTKTHWQFYNSWRVGANGDANDSLEHLTELYERATYSPVSMSEREAATAIDVATEIATDETVEP